MQEQANQQIIGGVIDKIKEHLPQPKPVEPGDKITVPVPPIGSGSWLSWVQWLVTVLIAVAGVYFSARNVSQSVDAQTEAVKVQSKAIQAQIEATDRLAWQVWLATPANK